VQRGTAALAVGTAVVAAAVAVGGSGLVTEAVTGTATAASPRITASTAAATVPTAAARAATNAEQVGVVDITTQLDFGEGEAAGTGVVLTPSGEVLTNNHVVDGATKIAVTVVGTGRSYAASVVGTDPSDDIAVLSLSGAADLATVRLATPAQVARVVVGDAVTAVGNAGGRGGTPSAAAGQVVALDRDITASDETGADAERLTGLIEVNAAVQPGDSGGPLYSDGVVIGIDTAASTSGRGRVATTAAEARSAGFAIPVTTATAIADRITGGERSSTIHQGVPAFLGVQLPSGTSGTTVSGVVRGSPAATAGLRAGDTITAVDGVAIDDPDALSTALAGHHPQDRVRITWSDASGGSHSATATLTTGPAD
jgi:S1-C subfamily serine protease